MSPKHKHLYHKVQYGKKGYTLYACHSCPTLIQPNLLIKREVTCNGCGNGFTIENGKDLIKVLKCKDCRRRKVISNEEALKILQESLESDFPTIGEEQADK
jgi:hypothetical protein